MDNDNKGLADWLIELAKAHAVDARTTTPEWKRGVARITAKALREAAAALSPQADKARGEDAKGGHSDACACLHPGDRECNCHMAYGFATAEDMDDAAAEDAALRASAADRVLADARQQALEIRQASSGERVCK